MSNLEDEQDTQQSESREQGGMVQCKAALETTVW